MKRKQLFFTLLSLCMGLEAFSAPSFNSTNLPVIHSTQTAAPVEVNVQDLDLGELFRYYGSDKDFNGYTSIYHTLFNHIKNEPITMLEIGIGTMIPGVHSSMVGYSRPGYKPGGSLRAWRDYFVNGTIIGADIQPDTQFDDEPRITTYLCNSTDPAEVAAFLKKVGNIKFDIIIDDGSHYDRDQLMTVLNLYPHLKDNGIYIVEDINPWNCLKSEPHVLAKMVGGDPFFFVGLNNNICVIYKNHLNRPDTTYSY